MQNPHFMCLYFTWASCLRNLSLLIFICMPYFTLNTENSSEEHRIIIIFVQLNKNYVNLGKITKEIEKREMSQSPIP